MLSSQLKAAKENPTSKYKIEALELHFFILSAFNACLIVQITYDSFSPGKLFVYGCLLGLFYTKNLYHNLMITNLRYGEILIKGKMWSKTLNSFPKLI